MLHFDFARQVSQYLAQVAYSGECYLYPFPTQSLNERLDFKQGIRAPYDSSCSGYLFNPEIGQQANGR